MPATNGLLFPFIESPIFEKSADYRRRSPGAPYRSVRCWPDGSTEIEGLYAANGCSGHGFKLAPAIGALLARMIVGEAATFDTRVDLGFLAPSRRPIGLDSKSVLA